jgi:hypothetical protein
VAYGMRTLRGGPSGKIHCGLCLCSRRGAGLNAFINNKKTWLAQFWDANRASEQILFVQMARIFNTYGPRMHSNDRRVVSNFVV